jgi:hypothetical protein
MQELFQKWIFAYQAIGIRYVVMTSVAFILCYKIFKKAL